jgi:hypothetical protein
MSFLHIWSVSTSKCQEKLMDFSRSSFQGCNLWANQIKLVQTDDSARSTFLRRGSLALRRRLLRPEKHRGSQNHTIVRTLNDLSIRLIKFSSLFEHHFLFVLGNLLFRKRFIRYCFELISAKTLFILFLLWWRRSIGCSITRKSSAA